MVHRQASLTQVGNSRHDIDKSVVEAHLAEIVNLDVSQYIRSAMLTGYRAQQSNPRLLEEFVVMRVMQMPQAIHFAVAENNAYVSLPASAYHHGSICR